MSPKRAAVMVASVGLFWQVLVHPALAQSDPLGSLVKGTGLTYLEYQGIYVFSFKPDEASGVDRWMVRVAYNSDKKSWICISCTMIDKEDNYKFPEAVKERLLRYNSQVPGSKFSIDQANGDIDVEWELPTQFATSELLAYMIRDVAATCDGQHDTIANMLK
ncbi:MAG: hypothetical protein ONB23_05935 [candidate division KSB1 bacterium]|nr:hypothetical protein [candidate division KSB1 bacterium]